MFSNKKIKILITILITLTIFIAGLTTNTYALEFELKEKEYSEAYKRWLELDEKEREKTIPPNPYVINITKKDTYNLKSRISTYEQALEQLGTSVYSQYKIPNLVIKNQMDTNQCWAFALNSAIESTYLKQTGESIDLSERHMDYATAKYLLNETGTEIENPIGFEREIGKGGNSITGAIYSTNGTGLVYEEDMPFENNETLEKTSEILNKERKVKVSDYIFFPSIFKERQGNIVTYTNGETGINRIEYTLSQVEQARNEMKEHIYNYGGITSVTHMGTELLLNYINVDRTNNRMSYYCDDNDLLIDHAITIVGWDDTYSKTNFKTGMQPTTDGAWICLNSSGTNIVGEGYIYISYEDVFIEATLIGIKKAEKVNNEKIYQHDFYGGIRPYYFSETLSTIYAMNVFQRNSNDTEYLTEVSLNLLGGQEVELYIEENGNIVYTKNIGAIEETGYYTIELENPILLTGETFKVITKNKSISGPVYLTIEENINGFITKATSQSGESYISADGQNWQDLTTITNTSINFCIKAFTKLATQTPVSEVKLNKTQTTIQVNQTETLTATVLPENATNKNVTWSSSNENIVTVDSQGVIRGISAGTAQITVTTQDGEKTATCTVTVEEATVTITISSTEYLIQNKDISKVKPNTTKQQFINNIQTNGTITIKDKDGTAVQNTETITTGMILELNNGDKYEIAVVGDLNGDGESNLIDLSRMKLHQVSAQLLTGIYLKAADINYDNSVNLIDLSRIKLVVVGLIQL